MRFFPALFIIIVSLMHAYLFWNLQRVFRNATWQYYGLAILVVSMSMVIMRRQLRGAFIADLFYIWLGFLFMVTIGALARDAAEWGVRLLDMAAGTHIRPLLASPKGVAIGLVLGVLLFFYGLYEAWDIRIHRVTVRTALLPEGVERLRIALLTDLHLTPSTREETVKRIVAMTNAEKPDLTVAAGDFIDGEFPPDGAHAKALAELSAPLGTFAVTGNHELYSGFWQAIRFIEGAGFRLLRGEAENIGGITVVGVDDPQLTGRVGIPEALAKGDANRFVLLLSHRPETPEAALGRFDLELSGHTHGGQIWPGWILARLLNDGYGQGLSVRPAPAGRPRRQSLVYVSNGTRFWGPPVRFLAPPEITVIDVVRETDEKQP